MWIWRRMEKAARWTRRLMEKVYTWLKKTSRPRPIYWTQYANINSTQMIGS